MLPIWQIAMIVGKDCAESVTVANPVMNVIAWKVFEELGQETTLNRQITENNIERDSMGTRILDFYRLFPQLFRAEIEMYQAFKDHAYFLGMVASDLYHNRKNDTALLKIWEKNENKKLLDELREIHIEDYESTTKSEHIRHINGKTIEISNLIELHYIRRTMNKFYTMTHSSLTKSDEERIENSKVLFQKLYDFRLDVYTEIQELNLSNWDTGFKDRSEEERQERDLIKDCFILHAQTQFLKIYNTTNELNIKINQEREFSIEQYTGSTVYSMEYIWTGKIRHFGFKKFPLKEFQKEFLLLVDSKSFRSKNLMLDFAREFYSIGIHNMIVDAISTFNHWSQEEFEQAWKDDWGYDFDDDSEPRIEKKRNALRIDLREQILQYDPLLRIAIEDKLEREFDKPSKIDENEHSLRAFSRLCEFVEVQLLLTKIVHLSSRARFWKGISKKIEKLKGKRFLSGNVYSLELNKTDSENEEMLREYATNETSGQGWELFALSSWFLKNKRNSNSKLHLLMLEANLYEGTIHGIEWNEEEEETSESDWGEKIIIELMPFEHDKLGKLSASYLYLTTKKESKNLVKRQDIAYQYSMERNASQINRGLNDSEFNSLIYERRTGMTDLNTKYGELLRENNEQGLKDLVRKIVERYSADTTLMRSDSNRIPSEVPLINFDCKNLNHFGSTGKNLNYVLLVQEIKFNSKKYWAVHGDEWGANFLVDKKMVEPIDFEDVIFTEKIKNPRYNSITYYTGGGTLSSRFVNARIVPQGFEFHGLAPVNLLSSLGRLVASLIQYQIRVKEGQTTEFESKFHHLFLELMHEQVKAELLSKAKTNSEKEILKIQYNLSIIDWLAHWVNKGQLKMPKLDFQELTDYIAEKFLPSHFQEMEFEPRNGIHDTKNYDKSEEDEIICPVCKSPLVEDQDIELLFGGETACKECGFKMVS